MTLQSECMSSQIFRIEGGTFIGNFKCLFLTRFGFIGRISMNPTQNPFQRMLLSSTLQGRKIAGPMNWSPVLPKSNSRFASITNRAFLNPFRSD